MHYTLKQIYKCWIKHLLNATDSEIVWSLIWISGVDVAERIVWFCCERCLCLCSSRSAPDSVRVRLLWWWTLVLKQCSYEARILHVTALLWWDGDSFAHQSALYLLFIPCSESSGRFSFVFLASFTEERKLFVESSSLSAADKDSN